MSDQRLIDAVIELSRVMADLRAKCPWDAAQTHQSLRRYLIEECHEVLDALDREDPNGLQGELGDLLFQIWFHAEVASEGVADRGLASIIEQVTEKLTRRHPHVFGGAPIDDAAAVKKDWESLKQSEGVGRKSRLDGVPPLIPALLGAQCLQEKAASVGFDWEDVNDVLAKIEEEIGELRQELGDEGKSARRQHEFGDVLLSLVNLGRHLGITAEDALREANTRFTSRFQFIEQSAIASGRTIADLTLAEMEAFWQLAKERSDEG